MSELFQKVNQMLQNNEIPDEFKNMMNQFTSNTNGHISSSKESESSENSWSNGNFASSESSKSNKDFKLTESSESNENTNNQNNFQFDINTMLKMKSIIDAFNRNQNDPRSNLLKSLKPYLKPSRKEKVDQYIQLLNMGKVFEMMNPLEGEKKNDI